MRFEILHTTEYRYADPASEAYIETRLTPPPRPSQRIVSHEVDFQPSARTSRYTDYFGNAVDFFSMTLRHARLAITNRLRVETAVPEFPGESMRLSVAESRQLFSSSLTDVFEFLQATPVVPVGGDSSRFARQLFAGDRGLGAAVEELNSTIYHEFEYFPGSTDNTTPLQTVLEQRKGVCQDFAHVMLSVLRTAGLPARYVCGYIESDPPPEGSKDARLVGSLATHAWVEVLAPGGHWVGIDPTNNQWCGERHVAVSVGRDFRDAAPVRGTFKGSAAQRMKVRITMKRLKS